jgi:hypothetical protein
MSRDYGSPTAEPRFGVIPAFRDFELPTPASSEAPEAAEEFSSRHLYRSRVLQSDTSVRYST